TTRKSGSACRRSRATPCFSRAISCTRCRRTRDLAASRSPSTRSRPTSTHGVTRSRSAADAGPSMSSESRRRALALVLTVSSGCAALGYQIVWTQQAALWLGHESAAVLAVIAAFFGGLALGPLLLGARAHATPSPARWFAACEAAI